MSGVKRALSIDKENLLDNNFVVDNEIVHKSVSKPGPKRGRSEVLEDDDDDAMKLLMTKLQSSNNMKASRKRARMEQVVDQTFRTVEGLIKETVREQQVAIQTAQQESAVECRRVQLALEDWAGRLMTTTETYHKAMQVLTNDFKKMITTFSSVVKDIQNKAQGSDSTQRAQQTAAKCSKVMDALKSEISASVKYKQ